jgi:hypothetical protein
MKTADSSGNRPYIAEGHLKIRACTLAMLGI